MIFYSVMPALHDLVFNIPARPNRELLPRLQYYLSGLRALCK
jgi:hypothetical protein